MSRSVHHTFSGGEVSDTLYGRTDLVKYGSSLSQCKGFIVLPQGPVTRRPGTIFVREVKDSTKPVRLIPFTFNTTQTMVLEVGEFYMRFHSLGGTLLYSGVSGWSNFLVYNRGALVLHSGVVYYLKIDSIIGGGDPASNPSAWYPLSGGVYEIPTPYQASQLFDLHYVQSNDVLTIVHPSHPPQELRRQGATLWTLKPISFTSPISAPGVLVTRTSGNNAGQNLWPYSYVVTSVMADGFTESTPSSTVTVNGNLFAVGEYNTVSWSPVPGASLYRVYRRVGGVFGFIGSTSLFELVDANVTPDTSATPPNIENPFAGNNNPGAVCYFEQRRVFAGTTTQPQNVWMTRFGTESTMSYSYPTKDEDRISFRVAARESNTIRHVVPLLNMIILTSGAEWRVYSQNSDELTPKSVSVKAQSYTGANNVHPVVVGNSLLYAAARGGHMQEMAYAWQSSGYVSNDISLLASHLFDNKTIVDMGFSKSPTPVLWAINNEGILLSMTYVPEQQVAGWSWHDTGASGKFESVAVVAEGNEDIPYFVVRRLIDGVYKRYVETMAPRQWTQPESAVYLDSSLMYSGAPTTTISGLDHLEGAMVSVWGDGQHVGQLPVVSGEVTLPYVVSDAVLGLSYHSALTTLPLAPDNDGGRSRGAQTNVGKVRARVVQAGQFSVGQFVNGVSQDTLAPPVTLGLGEQLFDGVLEVDLMDRWFVDGRVSVEVANGNPLTLTELIVDYATGG